MPEKAKEKKVQKKKSMEKQERRRIKDFFDRIAPSTIRFYADHYIVGDSYRCAWAIREYPPSTDEQAIFSRIADKSGVTLRIYHRLVEPMEQRKIIQNAMRKNKLKSGGTDMTETVEAEGNLQDVIELLPNIVTSTLKGIVAESDNKQSRLLFKLAVEMAMMMNLLAASQEVDKVSLERLRGECVREVKRLNGSFSFEDALDWQKG